MATTDSSVDKQESYDHGRGWFFRKLKPYPPHAERFFENDISSYRGRLRRYSSHIVEAYRTLVCAGCGEDYDPPMGRSVCPHCGLNIYTKLSDHPDKFCEYYLVLCVWPPETKKPAGAEARAG